jgi:hypothetical protein
LCHTISFPGIVGECGVGGVRLLLLTHLWFGDSWLHASSVGTMGFNQNPASRQVTFSSFQGKTKAVSVLRRPLMFSFRSYLLPVAIDGVGVGAGVAADYEVRSRWLALIHARNLSVLWK